MKLDLGFPGGIRALLKRPFWISPKRTRVPFGVPVTLKAVLVQLDSVHLVGGCSLETDVSYHSLWPAKPKVCRQQALLKPCPGHTDRAGGRLICCQRMTQTHTHTHTHMHVHTCTFTHTVWSGTTQPSCQDCAKCSIM